MRWLLLFFLAAAGPSAWCESITEVLARSQQQRLEANTEADPQAPSTRTVRQSFEALLKHVSHGSTLPACELRVVTGPALAETLHGRVIVVNQSLANLTEGERLFILGHELGHVLQGHWPQMTKVYQTWIPGDVVKEKTDAVAGRMGREASALAYQHELEADSFGLRVLRELGYPPQQAFSAFVSLGMQHDSPTHPGTRKRLASLRAAAAALAVGE